MSNQASVTDLICNFAAPAGPWSPTLTTRVFLGRMVSNATIETASPKPFSRASFSNRAAYRPKRGFQRCV